jgi:ribose transport system substrate-binding protein
MKSTNKMLRILIVAICIFVIAISAVAVDKTSVGQFKGAADETYYMCVMVSGVEYWFPVYEMFKQCAWQLGVKSVYTGTPDYDVNKQIAVFEQILVKKPAGIFVHPMNADAFVTPINKAIDSGVPVVTFAADSPNSKRRVYITSDNVFEGQVAADALSKAIGGEGEIAILENPGQSNHDLYIKSFIAAIESKYPKIKIVARAATNQDTAKAYSTTLTMIQGHPKLKAVIMPEAASAQGAAQATKEKGGKVLVLTRDLNVKILDMIKAGEVWGSINPDQGNQGYFGMLTLFLLKHSNMIDPMSDWQQKKVSPVFLPFINNGMNVVTKANADYYYWDKYLKRRGTKGIQE